ncbi:hypothetical protein CARUB_v10021180mg [Capsella rubella]|uniref:Uncharacterized protein n=1 Tax=Capsella rubella TaxID=81985 RepID=R0GJ63_9BRAS|nr:hypothetical protein CARUB_v10021180mg [Capsella rubella]
MCILEENSPCMVPTVEARKDGEVWQLSAMQFSKGVKKGDPTYLAFLKLDDELGEALVIPPVIEKVLEQNKDIMPPKLPEKLPPRREVDHRIELEVGAKPPAMAPYRMAPSE